MVAAGFDFSHYFLYEEIVAKLEELAARYPELMTLVSLGKSYEGRDIWLATITSRATGFPGEKPGYWVDANTHAGEVTGSAVALYIITALLDGYGCDASTTRLLDHYTLYVLPRLAVDGAECYLTTAERLRSGTRPFPWDQPKDGLHPQDLNGDGLILQMRMVDPGGAWKVSGRDPRLMVRRHPHEFGGVYYSLATEGMIRNFDGFAMQAAPPLRGLDFNRNYPYEWKPHGVQRGAGDVPFSEPETRAEAEFWRRTRNINGFMSFHTASAVILRPYSCFPDEHMPNEDLEIYKIIGDIGTELTSYKCVSSYHDYRAHAKEFMYGAMDDYVYENFGWFGFTMELWDAPTAAGVKKDHLVRWFLSHSEEDDLKLLRWNDQSLGGRGFVSWQPFVHPQLGAVEIGGWDYKRVLQNSPAEYLPKMCEQQLAFVKAHALLCPRMVLENVVADAVRPGVYVVTLDLINEGFLPTYTSKKALEKEVVPLLRAFIELPDGASLLEGLPEREVGHLEGRSCQYFGSSSGLEHRRRVRWSIHVPGGGTVTVGCRSDRAGTVKRTIILKNSDS